jgi:ribulose-phosphate 3-epimerase
MKTLLSASMACANPLEYRATVARLDETAVDALHFDLCDGHFAPTLLLAPNLLRALRPLTTCRFDVHLYCTHPSRYLAELRSAGANVIIVQIEAAEDIADLIAQIVAGGMQPGVAILPTTLVPATLAPLLPALAMVVVNMVGPAYAGQPFDVRGLENARAIAALAHNQHLALEIAADGHVSREWLPDLLASGCTHLVCGTSSIFLPDADIGDALVRFRQSVADAERAHSAIKPA